MENYRKLRLLGRGSEGYLICVYTERYSKFNLNFHILYITSLRKFENVHLLQRYLFSTVGLYRRLSDDKNVVLKEVYLGKMTKDDEEVTSNEVKVLSMLNHPNIIKYYDSFFDNDTIIIVMEYAPGGTLHDYLRMRNSAYLSEEELYVSDIQLYCVSHLNFYSKSCSKLPNLIFVFISLIFCISQSEGIRACSVWSKATRTQEWIVHAHSTFSFKEALSLFAQIVLGIHHVHSKNILHRDLKTQNIFLTQNKQIIKMGDFGISKVMNTRSKAVSLVGTPSYLSPELCEGCPYNEKIVSIWANISDSNRRCPENCLSSMSSDLFFHESFYVTLSGIVTKVMQGSIIIEEEWKPSKCTCNLLHSLLRKDASLRPSTAVLFAHPALMTVFPKLMLLGATSPIQPLRAKLSEQGETLTSSDFSVRAVSFPAGTTGLRHRNFLPPNVFVRSDL
ncbi:hypothetical protein J437_LFUL012887 [Ladona fulva]|uniref:Protein kinase domain-containing protein n=1 Tax=Ladona fulva TaxID=123851 RepID=A0A8K0P493_LADFU|nr:hypothetical protein J437_LFUL012887 [Ladona fulva]